MGRLNATDEEVLEAARKAQCMEFLEKLPQGIHSMAGDAGKMLSGGQRQRISLARAILKDAPIVILDEATASVDADNDTIALAKRNFDNKWESKVLDFHRKWSTLVAPTDIMMTNMVATITNITKVYNEFQKFPEKDRYLVSKVYADWTAQSKTADTTARTDCAEYPANHRRYAGRVRKRARSSFGLYSLRDAYGQ